MLLGPVFHAELLRTARQRRYYVARALYGLVLLFIVWIGYAAATAVSDAPTIDQAAEFAEGTFTRFAVVQIVGTLLMIPALFGGTIADEKQRKTLHYLMASRLSSFEIILDKVLGRASHLAVFLALGLPVVCLLGLFGGVAPEYVAIAYLGTTSTATMAVALTVLVSTLSRKVGQAILVAYVLLLAWQVVPSVVRVLWMNRLFPVANAWLGPINDWVGTTTPLYVYLSTMIRTRAVRGIPASGFDDFAWMVGLQLGAAALLVALAVWQLRPTFRRHEATPPRRKWFEGAMARKPRRARPPRWYDRPECGDDAMGWKERYFARTDIFTKLAVMPATILVTVFLVLHVGIDESLPRAITDVWHRGFWGWGTGGDALVDHLRIFSAWYVVIWLLAIAGASASSVTVEREEDTWVSLTSTPLSGWEILRGKVLGAAWAQRGFGVVPLGLWAIGLLTGAVHPVGFLGTVLAFGVATWMVAAVGVHASLRSTSTSRALTSAIGRLFILYGYPFILVAGFTVGTSGWSAWELVVGWPPSLVVGYLASYRQVGELWGHLMAGHWRIPPIVFGAIGLVAMVLYALIAAALTHRSVRLFDRWLDRPELSADAPGPRRPAPRVEAPEPEPALQS